MAGGRVIIVGAGGGNVDFEWMKDLDAVELTCTVAGMLFRVKMKLNLSMSLLIRCGVMDRWTLFTKVNKLILRLSC